MNTHKNTLNFSTNLEKYLFFFFHLNAMGFLQFGPRNK
jgi:hypothetical protein